MFLAWTSASITGTYFLVVLTGWGRTFLPATGPIIQTCLPDLEGRVEILCELRTEKPWRGGVGPEFDSRQLHFMPPDLLQVGGYFSSFSAGCGAFLGESVHIFRQGGPHKKSDLEKALSTLSLSKNLYAPCFRWLGGHCYSFIHASPHYLRWTYRGARWVPHVTMGLRLPRALGFAESFLVHG